MSNWEFDKPDETEPGEHAYALVVYTGTKEVGVRCMERDYIRRNWGRHVFAWKPMVYPTYSIKELSIVVDQYKRMPVVTEESST